MAPETPAVDLLPTPVVVTGAGGFLGSELVRRLAGTPRVATRAVLRPSSRATIPAGVERRTADFDDTTALAATFAGARAVVHAAAALGDRAAAEMARVNVDGTRNAVDAALAAGVERFVLISSAGVYGVATGDAARDETAPLAARDPYGASKRDAEHEAARFAAADRALTILRPSGLYGPGRALYADLLARLGRRSWRVTLPGESLVQPCHVRDLAGAVLASLADAAPGARIFNVAGREVLPLEELHDRVAVLAGLTSRRIRLPPALARPLESLAALRGGVPADQRAARRALARGERVGGRLDTTRVERRYGLAWTPLEEGLREMVAAFVARGGG